MYKISKLEAQAECLFQFLGMKPEREYRFDKVRKWRFDFAFPTQKIAVEIEGGTFGKSRHTTGTGYSADCEKYNAAALLGWRVFRFTGKMITVDNFVKVYNLLKQKAGIE